VKKAMINYIKRDRYDEIYTPSEAVYPLLEFLPKDKIYWECTDPGNSNITKVLIENGYKVISTHIKDGFDFLRRIPDFEFDIIITNPPYSLKTQFLKRAYEIGKPFAFLLPIHTLEGRERSKLFRKYGIQVLVLDRRLNFLDGGKSGAWFNTSWFCWKLLPKDLIFKEVPRRNEYENRRFCVEQGLLWRQLSSNEEDTR